VEARKKVAKINMDFLKLCEKKLEDIELKRSTGHFKENRTIFRKLVERWGSKKEINRNDVEEYINEVAAESKPKANKYLRRIKSLFNFGVERGWTSDNPAVLLKSFPVDKKKKYIPPKADILKILKIAKGVDRAYLMLIIHTLARVREINYLKWEDVHEGYLTLWTRKSRNSNLVPRDIPLNKVLKGVLKKIPKKGAYVFINPRTKNPYDYRDKFLATLCRKAEVKPFTYHNLRHFGASMLASNGAGLGDIQGILGHSQVSTTDGYIQSLRTGMVDAMKKMEGVK
jgi:integrase